MESFLNFISEDIKKLGKIKLSDGSVTSHRFKSRGQNRKTLRQVPDKHDTKKTRTNIKDVLDIVKGMDTSSKIVDTAKASPRGVWKLSKQEVMDIAKKYKFIIPNKETPTKHLGSTGIQMVRVKPGTYYLYKPQKQKYKRRKQNIGGIKQDAIKGI